MLGSNQGYNTQHGEHFRQCQGTIAAKAAEAEREADEAVEAAREAYEAALESDSQ